METTIINHIYKVDYKKPTELFKFEQVNSIVDYTHYKNKIIPKIEDIAYELHKNPKSRKAFISVNEGIEKFNTCLIGYQFQISDETLYVTVYQRSQCAKLGKPFDIQLVNYVIYILKLTSIFKLYYRHLKTDITFVIGNYHERTDITG